MIIGEDVYLTAIDMDNAEVFRGWYNDADNARWLLPRQYPLTTAQERQFLEEAERSDGWQLLEIHVRDDDRLIGLIGFEGIDLRNRHAELGILVGVKEERGKGYGADAIVTCLRYAFETLGLHSVFLGVIEGNDRALDLYRKLGFSERGRMREWVFSAGEFRDAVLCDILASEFSERHGATE